VGKVNEVRMSGRSRVCHLGIQPSQLG